MQSARAFDAINSCWQPPESCGRSRAAIGGHPGAPLRRALATLTQRLNTTRKEGDKSAANRRIFYDFTFSPPKSVSIAGFLGGDERILEAHARAVRSALREFEAFAATRIRAGGAQNDRMTP